MECLPVGEPRQKLLQTGPETLSDHELLSLVLHSGRGSAISVAHHLLGLKGGLRQVLGLSLEQFCLQRGLGVGKYVQFHAMHELVRRYLMSEIRPGAAMDSPHAVRQYLRAHLHQLEREVFCCLFLDTRHRIIHSENLFFGTIDGASVYPREVVKRALSVNAAALIFAHNHPSGVAEPSAADRHITEKLVRALALVDIRVLDHLVVGGPEVVSFAERGLL
jgi:DNA repair protein RadC